MTLLEKVSLTVYVIGAIYYVVFLMLKFRSEDRDLALSAVAALILSLVWPLWILSGFLLGILKSLEAL